MKEPTTKNDLAHNLCDSCTNIGCEFQSGIVRTKCVFYMPPQLEPDNCGNYVVQASATKNDLAVDCISRDEVCRYVAEFVNHEFSTKEEEELIDNIITGIERMPSVTPQIPTVRRERGRIKVNVSMDLTVSQAFHILLQTLNVELDDVPPKFEIVDGEIVCDQDNRGELYLALYHLATKIFPNTEFRHLFDDPNILMNDLYSAKEIEVEE